MILDDIEANPDKYEGKNLKELADEEDFDEENSIEYSKAYYKKALLTKMITVSSLSSHFSFLSCIYLTRFFFRQKVSVRELDLEAALAERQV